ncbi:guanitoxin biosynthesis heme-dependent pre-guanitoxin N-hydroxylase GntA [Streptomyces sp. NPDC058678]|uniref:guanitoxin biosynthesis heme-dependent pre-guanitoxin N-hydroxylase GntA n=1 Tax=Streptomyces sp. NPDC058678 TaxID=3346595 RepID=UPI0036616187
MRIRTGVKVAALAVELEARMAHHELKEEFIAWVGEDSFTCLGARAALRQNTLVMQVYEELDAAECTARLHRDLAVFVDEQLTEGHEFASFVALFLGPRVSDEEEFEELLWRQLGRLHRFDARTHSWSPGYSSDPESREFAFSVAGHPFFVAGFNPEASRISRRFSRPVLVFNSHEQFTRLKAQGTYYGLQRRIREREVRLQGSVNPMLSDHGETSEARQYSGRAVPVDWTCPFSPEAATTE